MYIYTPKLPGRQELTDRLINQGPIPRRVLEWANSHPQQAAQPEYSEMVTQAKAMMTDLGKLARAWVDHKIGKEELMVELRGFERRRCQINDLWLRLEPSVSNF